MLLSLSLLMEISGLIMGCKSFKPVSSVGTIDLSKLSFGNW
jgi:hypothetical protein